MNKYSSFKSEISWGCSDTVSSFRSVIYIGVYASLSEFGVGTYSGADWLKSADVSIGKKNRLNCPATSGKWFTKQPVAHTC